MKKGQQLTLDNASSLLVYEPIYKVIICTEHQYALQNIERHLEEFHGGNKAVRVTVVQSFSEYETVGPSELQLPEPLGQPIASLGKPLSAFHCSEDECGYISTSHTLMRKHCNKDHDWHSTRTQREYWTKIWVQKFFTGSKGQYFSVLWDGGNMEESNTGVGVMERLDIELIKNDWDEELRKKMKELEIIEKEVMKQDRTGWFDRTKWPKHLGKSNMKHLAHTSRLADRNEADLIRVQQLVDILLERCIQGLETLHPETRRWLKSARLSEPDIRPISRLQSTDSQKRYNGYWKRFMCYCLRIAKRVGTEGNDAVDTLLQVGSRDETESELGDETESELGDETLVEMDNESAYGSDDGSEEESESESADEGQDGVRRGGGEEATTTESTSDRSGDTLHDAVRLFRWNEEQLDLARRLLQTIDFGESEESQLEALLKFGVSFIFQSIPNDTFDSRFIHFLAVLGIDEEMGRLRTANDYSYVLAGLVYDIRVLAVEYLLPSQERKEQSEAEIDAFLEKRRGFLADGSYSPMSSMLSLLAYGKNLALNHGNASMV